MAHQHFHTFTRTSVRVSKINTDARAQLTFQMLTLLKKTSISLATYLSDIEWLTSFRQRNYMVSISIRHRVAISTLHKNNDIKTIMAYLPRLRFLTSNGRYRVLGGIGSYLYHLISADMSVQHSVACIETILKWCCFFIDSWQCSCTLLNIEWSTWRQRWIPSYRYNTDVGQRIGLHGIMLLISG